MTTLGTRKNESCHGQTHISSCSCLQEMRWLGRRVEEYYQQSQITGGPVWKGKELIWSNKWGVFQYELMFTVLMWMIKSKKEIIFSTGKKLWRCCCCGDVMLLCLCSTPRKKTSMKRRLKSWMTDWKRYVHGSGPCDWRSMTTSTVS